MQQVPQFNLDAFVQVHAAEEKITSVRVNPAKFNLEDSGHFTLPNQPDLPLIPEPVPWSRAGYYLHKRPSFTFDPLFHAGCYYVQEASSMFLEQALLQHLDLQQPLKVLDLCAAPGGKSTHLQSLLRSDSLLVSNEVIKTRAGVLRQNVTKWGGANVVVTSNDPQHFARLEGFFDVLVVDAPCSGSGLFRRDPQAIGEWSEDAVALCWSRQKRILADALPCLKEGGLLVYSTCSYSPQEDEAIGDWLVAEWNMLPQRLRTEAPWNIVETVGATGAYGYRFFPDKLRGEGFYLACFTQTKSDSGKWKTTRPEKATAKEQSVIAPWLQDGELAIFKEGFFYALPATLVDAFAVLKANLYIQQAGIRLGDIMKDKLVPDHALALSGILGENVPATELSNEEAVRYLQRLDLSLSPAQKAWQTVTYHGHNLGWINALPNRVNNYYPKEFRILKQ